MHGAFQPMTVEIFRVSRNLSRGYLTIIISFCASENSAMLLTGRKLAMNERDFIFFLQAIFDRNFFCIFSRFS